MLNDNHNYKVNIIICIGYACRADKNPYGHDRRADKNPYRHDSRADKNPYRHDRRADSQCHQNELSFASNCHQGYCCNFSKNYLFSPIYVFTCTFSNLERGLLPQTR